MGFAKDGPSQVVNRVLNNTKSQGNFPTQDFTTASNQKRSDNSQVINSDDVNSPPFHLSFQQAALLLSPLGLFIASSDPQCHIF